MKDGSVATGRTCTAFAVVPLTALRENAPTAELVAADDSWVKSGVPDMEIGILYRTITIPEPPASPANPPSAPAPPPPPVFALTSVSDEADDIEEVEVEAADVEAEVD